MTESTKSPVRLQLVLVCHQPLSVGEAELDRSVTELYEPLIGALETNHKARLALHISGHLLDHLAKRHEALLLRIKELAANQRLEILGGLFYGGAPSLMSELDVRGQLQMLSEFWESFLGMAPQGFFLPHLTWSVDLPRLFQDSGLNYGFVSASQIVGSTSTGLGVVERGDERISAFVLDPALSSTLGERPEDEWIEAALDRGSRGEGVLSVWVPAERLRAALGAWSSLLAQLSSRPELSMVLPSEGYLSARPATTVKVTERCPQELIGDGNPLEWSDFARLYPEAELLLRRVQRASDKLKAAIDTMQDEELEQDWNDVLATAQRLVFSAQAADAYWTSPTKLGFLDAALREEAVSRLVRAEAMLDALVQGNDDWIATEEEDLDADLADEVFVCTRQLTAWVAPQAGGVIRAIDQRLAARPMLDMAAHRPDGVSDGGIVREVSERLLDERASAAELFSGTSTDLMPKRVRWKTGKSQIDEEGDCSYHLELSGRLALAGVSPRELVIEKHVEVPIDAPEVRLHYKLALNGAPEIVFAAWMPLKLAPGELSLTVNGEVQSLRQELHDVDTLELTDASGTRVTLTCSPRCDVWIDRREDGGVVVAPAIRVQDRVDTSLVFGFPVEEAAAQELDEDTYEEESEEAVEEEVLEEEDSADYESGEDESALEEGDDDTQAS